MKIPKGKGFDLVCGLVITVVLDDFTSLTGTFLGEIQEKCHHRRCDEFHEFILIQLTCPVCKKDGPKIAEGTFCAINVDKIQFIFPGMKCPDKKEDDKCHEKSADTKENEQCDENKEHDSWDDNKW
ncbi:hypothetical protein [Pelosinus sp. sgz500959]|uniref:hypothetical protein n=1 Tax=Pelosinus sp. sgz500959 TaxID=3242472 RepID=UPI00366E6CC3